MATLDDIALALGISKGTVSKALNGAKDVSKRTQQAVLEKELPFDCRFRIGLRRVDVTKERDEQKLTA